MAESEIHIVRDGIELGVFRAAEAQELMATGFFLPTDMFWICEVRDARRLVELDPNEISPAQNAAKRMTVAVLNAADTLRQRATSVAARVSVAAGASRHEIDAAKNRLLEDFLPRLQNFVGGAFAQTSRTVESALRDEPFLRKLFGAVYDVIPRPVQRFVSEQTFVEFCLRHRDRLLHKETGASPRSIENNQP